MNCKWIKWIRKSEKNTLLQLTYVKVENEAEMKLHFYAENSMIKNKCSGSSVSRMIIKWSESESEKKTQIK